MPSRSRPTGGHGVGLTVVLSLDALEPGIGHAYRVEGPTVVIEFVDVQPDAEGHPANHIHCVWRDKTGDFDLPPGGQGAGPMSPRPP